MKRLVLCGIVILSVLGLMVGTAHGWGRWGGWGRGRGGWVGPAIAGGILGGLGARAYYGPRPYPYYGYPAPYSAQCPPKSYCEKYLDRRDPDCVRCYPELY